MQTHARQRRAYSILRDVAIESGYMSHQRDTTGFQRLADAIEAGTVRLFLRNTDASKK